VEVGKRADLAFWRIERPSELCYGLGANPCAAVMHRGVMRDAWVQPKLDVAQEGKCAATPLG
jgi:hypothetical protein